MKSFNNIVANTRRASRTHRVEQYDARDARIAGSVLRSAFRHGYRISETLTEEYNQIVTDGDANNQTAVY